MRQRYGEKMMCEPSRFLEELPQDDLEWRGGKATEKNRKEQGQGASCGVEGNVELVRYCCFVILDNLAVMLT